MLSPSKHLLFSSSSMAAFDPEPPATEEEVAILLYRAVLTKDEEVDRSRVESARCTRRTSPRIDVRVVVRDGRDGG